MPRSTHPDIPASSDERRNLTEEEGEEQLLTPACAEDARGIQWFQQASKGGFTLNVSGGGSKPSWSSSLLSRVP